MAPRTVTKAELLDAFSEALVAVGFAVDIIVPKTMVQGRRSTSIAGVSAVAHLLLANAGGKTVNIVTGGLRVDEVELALEQKAAKRWGRADGEDSIPLRISRFESLTLRSEADKKTSADRCLHIIYGLEHQHGTPGDIRNYVQARHSYGVLDGADVPAEDWREWLKAFELYQS